MKALELLGKEMEILTLSHQLEILGGHGNHGPNTPLGSDCVFNFLAHVSSVSGSSHYGSSFWSGIYSIEYSVSSSNGVNPDHVRGLIGTYFNVASASVGLPDYNGPIPSGTFIMTDYHVGSNASHAVRVMAIDHSNGTAVIYDPTSGGTEVKYIADLNYTSTVVITGTNNHWMWD